MATILTAIAIARIVAGTTLTMTTLIGPVLMKSKNSAMNRLT